MATRWRQVIALTDELHECDLVLISAPMWNFSVPWHLKRWIDCVVQARLTFSTNGRGHEGLLRGRPCVLLTSRDGLYRGRDATPGADFQIPYLRHVLGFMGLGPVYAVAADGMALPDRTLSLVAAQGEARSLARTVTALLRAPSSVREVP